MADNKIIVEIYAVSKVSDKTFLIKSCVSDNVIKKNNNLFKFYKKSIYNEKLYIYKNLILSIVDNHKYVYSKELINEHQKKNNSNDLIILSSKIIEKPLENFPFIDKYYDSISRTVTKFFDSESKISICIIDEYNNDNLQNKISYILLECDTYDTKKINEIIGLLF